MSGKHRSDTDQQKRETADNGVPRPRTAGFLTSATIAIAFAGFSAAVMVAAVDHADAPQQPAPQTLSAAQEVSTPPPPPLHQQGTIVAVSADSITARSADGVVQTYLVTPKTTAVTQNGGETFSTAVPFEVDDEVAIEATVVSGTATATAVADRAVIGQNGPPMDSL